MLIYIIGPAVVASIVMLLVGALLLIEARVVRKGHCEVVVNDDRGEAIQASAGQTLLSALVGGGILMPSACGGKGSCGTCRCKIEAGGGDVLPTELAHLSRKERLENVRIACQVKVRDDMRVRIPEEIFSIKPYHATVLSNDNVATFIKELVLQLDPDETLEFSAGAYVQIDIPEYDISYKTFDVADRYRSSWENFNLIELRAKADQPVFRAYSLANPPSEKGILRFTIRIATPPPGQMDLPPGVGSSYIFNLKPGDRVTLTGPYGDFFAKDTQREICYIGGGAGMAPMRSHILHQLLEAGTSRRISFWYGARSLQEMFYDEEFKSLEEQFENFAYHVALSDPQPEDNWSGLTGFIHQVLNDQYLRDHEDPTEIEYYLCGPPVMISSMEQMLDDLGVEPEMIAYDKFG